jgi:hypothetical protein
MNVSDTIVCINDSKPADFIMKDYKQWVVKGEHYTIRRIESFYSKKRVLLNEISNPVFNAPELGGGVEPGFNLERFRLVDPITKMEISEELIEKINI